MTGIKSLEINQITKLLKAGKIGVIPTDTIYGIVGSALNPEIVEQIYKLRKRALDKPMIILISSIKDLDKFDIKLSDKQKKFLEKNWPNSLSVILSVTDEKWEYLHRGTKTLAFRIPKEKSLLELLKQTDPLVAPSANFEGEKPAETIAGAKKYFGNNISFYIDGGIFSSIPSTIVELNEKGEAKVLRQGEYKV